MAQGNVTYEHLNKFLQDQLKAARHMFKGPWQLHPAVWDHISQLERSLGSKYLNPSTMRIGAMGMTGQTGPMEPAATEND
jgi:hypothetical protein